MNGKINVETSDNWNAL